MTAKHKAMNAARTLLMNKIWADPFYSSSNVLLPSGHGDSSATMAFEEFAPASDYRHPYARDPLERNIDLNRSSSARESKSKLADAMLAHPEKVGIVMSGLSVKEGWDEVMSPKESAWHIAKTLMSAGACPPEVDTLMIFGPGGVSRPECERLHKLGIRLVYDDTGGLPGAAFPHRCPIVRRAAENPEYPDQYKVAMPAEWSETRAARQLSEYFGFHARANMLWGPVEMSFASSMGIFIPHEKEAYGRLTHVVELLSGTEAAIGSPRFPVHLSGYLGTCRNDLLEWLQYETTVLEADSSPVGASAKGMAPFDGEAVSEMLAICAIAEASQGTGEAFALRDSLSNYFRGVDSSLPRWLTGKDFHGSAGAMLSAWRNGIPLEDVIGTADDLGFERELHYCKEAYESLFS